MKNSQDYSAAGRKIVIKESFIFLFSIGNLTSEIHILCYRWVEAGAAVPLWIITAPIAEVHSSLLQRLAQR